MIWFFFHFRRIDLWYLGEEFCADLENITSHKSLAISSNCNIIHIITPNSIKDLGLLLIIHMIRANIETAVSPIVGTEKQSEELVHYLLKEFETDPKSIWDTNIFGKSLYDLVNEDLRGKLMRMPDDARFKLQETLQRIINEGSGGLICIIL